MSHVKLAVQHGLTLDQAKGAARLAVEHYLGRFGGRGLSIDWLDDTHLKISAAVRGAKVQASVAILASSLQIEADVPLLLLPFKSVAAAAIERETQRWAAQARTGNLTGKLAPPESGQAQPT
jgi:hypothetical protein